MTELKATLQLEGEGVSPDQAFAVASALKAELLEIDGITEAEPAELPAGTRSATLLGLATVLVTTGTIALLIKAVQGVLETDRITEKGGIRIDMSNAKTGEHKSIVMSKDMDPEAVARIIAAFG